MASVLSSFSSLMGSVLSSFCSPSLLSLPPAPPPSPPPSSTPPQIKLDVFLSFRGEDTRNNFTSHLYKALVTKQIITFIDDRLNRGDEISSSLLKAIEESQIAIIIFSKDYASSSWCLKELVKILECRENHGQIVIPVFYKIEPSEVRNQTGSFEVAFVKHQSLKDNSSQVQKWKDALKQAGSISGFDSRVVKPESTLVEEIVQKVLKDLKRQNNISPSVNKKLVGIESMIKEIELCFKTRDQKHNDVCSVGIWGIGGIGKTTIAKALCEKISCQFEGFHFIESVREALEKKEPKCLRQELYLAILGDKNIYNYQLIKKRFSRMKLLIILDDVTSINQVDDLFGDLDCFGLGSRIIITSRDKQVLKNCRVDYIYEVKELNFDNALKLFCQHAFKQNCPEISYMELSRGIVKKVGGIPLALKVLGSFLLDKRKEVWESSIKKLENALDNNIYEVLKVSYDGLDSYQQELFLDIACFYKGCDVDSVIAIMDASGFCTDNELSALEDKCLIIKLDNKLMMHDLLQVMGKRIVQQESRDPGERTRLCDHNDIYDVLTNATGTKNIEGISLDMSNTGDIHLHPDAFVNLRNLRFLQIYIKGYWRDNNNKIYVPQDLKYLLSKLRYFQWVRCPLKSLQPNFHLKNLVILRLPCSNVEQLWSGVQEFDHLKEINLYSSQKLIRFPDLKAPKLERLNLEKCTHLIEMPSSFQHLTQLMDLCLSSCKNLASVPQLPKSLHDLYVINCSKLQRLPELPNNLERLNFRECSSLIEIPSSIHHLTRPNSLGLWGCSKLSRLPELPNNLKELHLIRCSSLIEISSSFKHLSKLGHLTIMCCESLTSIPDLTGLKSLKYLAVENCSKLKMLPEFPNSIEVLLVRKIPIEEWPPSLLPPSINLLHDLRHLCLSECGITEVPDSVCCLTSLRYLALDSNNFERIPETIMSLSNLSFLCISYCWRLKVLPKLPWAQIIALNCISLQELSCPSFPNDFFALNSAQFVSAKLVNCFKLDRNSMDSFVKDTQREIQAQSPSYRQVYKGKKPPLVICYPSSEIPERFTFQCIGSCIDVKLPLEWIDYNSLCFALCAVVSFPDKFELPDSCSAHVTYKCYVKSMEGSHNWGGMRGLLGGFYNTAGCSTRSSHVIIGFGFHFFRELHDNEFTFQFDCFCKVEKCGVHLLFGKHLEKSDQNEEVDEPYSEESEEEDEYSEESEEEEEEEWHSE